MKPEKTLLFSVTSKDFETQTFSVGGHGGSGKDTSNSGVRLVHKASGATGEGRETRSMQRNRRAAFLKLIETKTFKNWHRCEVARHLGKDEVESPEQLRTRIDAEVEQALRNGQIRVEEF